MRPDPDSARWAGSCSFTDLVSAEQLSLVRFAYLVTGNWSDAEDAVQDAVIAVQRDWDRVDPPGALAYVRKAVARRAMANGRRIRPTLLESVPESAEPDQQILRWEADQRFVGRLQILPAKQRAAVILRYFYDLPDARVADYLECSEETVRSQVYRALQRLRELEPNPSGGEHHAS